MAKNLKDLEDDDDQPATIPDEESDPVDASEEAPDAEEPAADAEEAAPIEFGKPDLLSQEDYAKKIHAPDEYGQVADRSPASEPTKEDTKAVSSFPSEEQVQKPASSLDRYKQFIDEYKRLQANRNKSDLVAGLAAASGKIGQSIAGKYSGNFTPDPAGPNLIRQMGERPVQDFEQGQVVQGRQLALKSSMDASNPASSQSKLTRDYLRTRLGIDLPDTVSATDAQLLLKTVGKPMQSKFQAKTGVYIDDAGKEHKIIASYDPVSGKIYNSTTHQEIPNERFIPEGLNPYQAITNPNTGEHETFNKSRGTAPQPMGASKAPALAGAETPNEVYATISPEVRKELNGKIAPEFNKATEKTRQRLTHVPVIMQRLQEAQTNPAALPQLKAELARFDVGDQRLAQQEFNMFGQRMGYSGVMDWLNAHTSGTISKDFADSMAQAISHVSDDLKGEMNDQAEERASQLIARFPNEAKDVDAGKIAPLIYGGYKPKEEKVKVRKVETGQEGFILKSKLKKAIASKKYEQVP